MACSVIDILFSKALGSTVRKTKNPSCREASEGSAPVWSAGPHGRPASADALSKYENSGAHGVDPPSGAPEVSSGWDGRLII
ncbi:hypothetical protein EKH77_23080 [Streptomyces luteoverticillatus]|uniref:Uncharacterized protein n=1 Tax=Streptomyces luteoverticillatus TaxID=66425 RepID=A0A3S9PMW1_STRLT|nr:hypothetical protein EKH77_23080 [Streptomyces luteoverticillatus]